MEYTIVDAPFVEINIQNRAKKDRLISHESVPVTDLGLTFEKALPMFLQNLLERGSAENTIKAFAHDLRILSNYFRQQTPVRNLMLEDLHSFLHWLEHDRGIQCSKKTLSRRIASTKGFFKWLHLEGHILENPASALKQVQADPYVPAVLDKREVRSLYNAASDMYWSLEKPDGRPMLLLSLLLETGMKKQECLNLRVGDFTIERDRPFTVTVRGSSTNAEYKTRALTLNHSTIDFFEKYCQSNDLEARPDAPLFDCTARNLEYILENLGQTAGIESCKVGFEVLRWTCAVNDFRLSMPEDFLRQKLGLSKVSWRDTRSKIETLL